MKDQQIMMNGNAESVKEFLSSVEFVPRSDWYGDTQMNINVAPNVVCVVPVHVEQVEDIPVFNVLRSAPLRGLEDNALSIGKDVIAVEDRDGSSNEDLNVVVDVRIEYTQQESTHAH